MAADTGGVTACVTLWCLGGMLLAALSGDVIGILFSVAAIVVFSNFASHVGKRTAEIEDEYDDEYDDEDY